jgi:hypothetical protein
VSIRFIAILVRVISVGLIVGGLVAGILWLMSDKGLDGLGLGITAGTLLFMGVIFFFAFGSLFQAAGPNIKNGIQGTAEVTSVQDTGTTINETVELFRVQANVSIPGVAPFPASLVLPIGRTQWGVLQPGVVLPVLVDPNDHSKVAYDDTRSTQTAGAGMAMGGGAPPIQKRSMADILERGIAATGTLYSATPTGLTAAHVNQGLPADQADDPLLQVSFGWAGPDGQQQTMNAMIRVPDGSTLPPPGSQVPVRYLPEEPTVATIDWSALN